MKECEKIDKYLDISYRAEKTAEDERDNGTNCSRSDPQNLGKETERIGDDERKNRDRPKIGHYTEKSPGCPK